MIINIKPLEYRGFLIRENDFGKALILKDSQFIESAEFVIKENIEGLEINDALGYNINNLDFLNLFPYIKHIRILNRLIDLNGLYNLKKLETLYLGDESKQELDFTIFKNLKRCSFAWRKNADSIFEIKNLTWLSVAKFPYNSLEKFAAFKDLTYLRVGSSKLENLFCPLKLPKLNMLSLSSLPLITSLDGINSFPNIESLEIYNLKNLSNLNSIKSLVRIKKLTFENCKKLGNINQISNLKNLEILHINNCDDIKSLNPIIDLKKLTTLLFIESTNIIDGNLNLIKNKFFKVLSFQDRKHYSDKKINLI